MGSLAPALANGQELQEAKAQSGGTTEYAREAGAVKSARPMGQGTLLS